MRIITFIDQKHSLLSGSHIPITKSINLNQIWSNKNQVHFISTFKTIKRAFPSP